MRHLTAAPKGEGGGWHYVSMNRRGGHPLGYCDAHEPHPTEAEARECYARWQRDNLELRAECWSWGRCAVTGCKAPANNGAEVRTYMGALAVLCVEHFTHEDAVKALGLDKPAGDAWVS